MEQDLHQVYGIDLDDRQLLRSRPARWLKARVHGLLNTPGTRLGEALADTVTPVP